MDLNALVPPPSSKKIAQVANKIFGYTIDVDRLSESKAEKLHKNLSDTLAVMESREGARAFNNKQFQELRIAKQALEAHLAEAKAKPDFLDLDKDGNKKEPMKKAAKDAKKKRTDESVITEGEVENAELVLAAKDMVDRIQGMLEDVGKMINEDLPPLTDAIRDEMDSSVADSFSGSMSTALQGLLDNLGTARTSVDEASRILVGETPAEPLGDEPGEITAPDAEMGTDPTLDAEPEDDFGASDAAVGGEEPMGREKAE